MDYTGERFLPEVRFPETSYEHWHRYLYASRFVQGKLVIDIACGEGYGAFLLAEKARKVVGVDISPEVIAHAASKYTRDNLEFLVGSVEAIPIEGEQLYDVIVSFETIEHLDQADQHKFLSEVKRLLKPNGLFVVSTPNRLAYSDLPGCRNEFHVKEFYVEEFWDFLSEYFPKVELLGQRIYPVSYVWPQRAHPRGFAEYRLGLTDRGFRPSQDPKEMVYVIALCSEGEVPTPTPSAALDISQRMFTLRDEQIAEATGRAGQAEEAVREAEAALQTLAQERDQLGREKDAALQALALQQDQMIRDREAALQALAQERDRLGGEKGAALQILAQERDQLASELDGITGTASWKVALMVRRARQIAAPDGSRRHRAVQRMMRGVGVLRGEGFRSFLRKSASRIFGKWSLAAGRLRELWIQKSHQLTYLESLLPFAVDSGPQNADEAVRWLAQTEIAGVSHRPLLTHPPSAAKHRLMIPPRSSFRSFLALDPYVWGRNPGGVEFQLSVRELRDGGRTLSRRRRIHPTQRMGERCWLEFRVGMRRFANQEVELSLSTSPPPGYSTDYAWALWGDPAVISYKGLGQVLARGFGLVRAHGLGALAGRVRSAARGPITRPAEAGWQGHAQAPIQHTDGRPAEVRLPGQHVAPSFDAVPREPTQREKAEQAIAWLEDERAMRRRIGEEERERLARFVPKRPQLISVSEPQVEATLRSLRFPAVAKPEVSIVIPVRDNIRLTAECLKALRQYSSDVSCEIIVVDDGSVDATPGVLGAMENVVFLRNPENMGFLRSCNRASEAATGKFLLFLNNDAQVTKGCLRRLLDTLRERPDAGAVSPKILYPDGRLQEAGAVVLKDGSTRFVGLFDDPDLPGYNGLREIEYASGVCLLMRSETFRELSGFDELFAPAYCEDVDLCFRIRDRGLRILCQPRAVVIHHLSATSNRVDEGYKKALVNRNTQALLERWGSQIDGLNRVRPIAFYLPQFHPIPENDRWWGKGFTEWRGVARARPNFLGHYQPRLPADLGFYDLRVPEVLEQQAELAKRYGIYGFCFYYYWFGGKRLLELPLERLLEIGRPDIPFCLCWANENWTRRWDGRESDILIAQQHSEQDDAAVIRDLARYMRHPNYIRVNGKPLLLVYRVGLFPDIKRSTETWRGWCRDAGIGEIYLALVQSFDQAREEENPSTYGFDSAVEFPPHEMSAPVDHPGVILNPSFKGHINDYREIVLQYLRKQHPGYIQFRGVMPSWDNTARRQDDSVIFTHTSPGHYQAWLEAIIQRTKEQYFGDERLVFVNAWNEWAEGTYLEPDKLYGHGYLEATRNALDQSSPGRR